ncbi:MAG TPA: (2Fe-2S)-binding protein [Nitrososphaerales archaeon]|nr:(2Fe-2S)-binding protein [Nitrososphaerales archaeon]
MRVNEVERTLEVESRDTLLDVLRDGLGLTGAKKGCDEAVCGSCAILFDNTPICSCTMFAVEASGHNITTIEGVSEKGKLSILQSKFVEHDALQCGFCTSGQIVVGTSVVSALRAQDAVPNNDLDGMISEEMSGNLCRCGCYNGIADAIKDAMKVSDED